MKAQKSFPNKYCPKHHHNYRVTYYGRDVNDLIVDILCALNFNSEYFRINWIIEVAKRIPEEITTWTFESYPSVKGEISLEEFCLLREKYFRNGEFGSENDFYYIESIDQGWSILVEKWDLEFVLITFDDSKKELFKNFEWKFSSDLYSFFSTVYLSPEIRTKFLDAVALNFNRIKH